MHTLPKLSNPTFTPVGDDCFAVSGTPYRIELGSSRWRICHEDEPVAVGFRTLEQAKLAFVAA